MNDPDIKKTLLDIQNDINEIKLDIALLKQRFLFYNVLIPILVFIIGLVLGGHV